MKLLGVFGLDWRIFLIQVLNFIVLFLILKKIFFARFISVLKKEKEDMERIEQEKQEIQKERAKMEKERESVIQKAKEKTRQILEEGKEISHEEKERILERTGEEVRKILEEAKEKAIVETQRAKAKAKEEIQNKAKELVKKVLSLSMSKEFHRRYVDSLIRELKNLDWSKIGKEENITVTLISAYPLNNKEREKISGLIFSKLSKCHLEEKIDNNLIAGIKILIDGFLIDGSLEGKIKELV